MSAIQASVGSIGERILRRCTASLAALIVFSPIPCTANGLGTKPPMTIGTSHPAINFVTARGASPAWADLHGKVVVMDFWATWCAPCLAAFPKLNGLRHRFAGKPVVFYSVTYETPAMVDPVLKRHPLETDVSYDRDFFTFKSFAAWAIPVVYVFDREGRLAAEVNASKLDAKLIETVMSGRRPSVPQQAGWDDPKGAEWYFRSLRAQGSGHGS